jgi:hypothetical protein
MREPPVVSVESLTQFCAMTPLITCTGVALRMAESSLHHRPESTMPFIDVLQTEIDMKKLARTPLFLPGAAIFITGWVVIFNNFANIAWLL